MARHICAAFISCLLLFVYPRNEMFTKYKSVEAYEVRPGMLAFPTYDEDGMVCEIGLERRQYSREIINLDPGLSREEIDEIVDELAPPEVRGPKSDDPFDDLMLINGPGMTTVEQYENTTVEIFTNLKRGANVVAVIQWKNRKCEPPPSEAD
jgi:hypothetical protein